MRKELKIDFLTYNENNVQSVVKVLARCFNIAAASNRATSLYSPDRIVKNGVGLLNTISQSPLSEPIRLSKTDEAYLRLNFMEIAKNNVETGGFVSEEETLNEQSVKMLKQAVKLNIVALSS
jgi:hypothetical protein